MNYVLFDTLTGTIQAWMDSRPDDEHLVENQGVIESSITPVMGKYYKVDTGSRTVVEVIYATSSEPDWSDVRMVRNALIAQTDYAVTADYPIEADLLAQVKEYRTALRNITDTFSTPETVVWPKNPLDKPKTKIA
ncbi:MAG: hypothetical protein EOP83_12315 [Verrucomicrobiaceae bacterium]|nr:MAG: hypothetical protein EOP83_12315 [Verrucomicrobiaceae bacterium]